MRFKSGASSSGSTGRGGAGLPNLRLLSEDLLLLPSGGAVQVRAAASRHSSARARHHLPRACSRTCSTSFEAPDLETKFYARSAPSFRFLKPTPSSRDLSSSRRGSSRGLWPDFSFGTQLRHTRVYGGNDKAGAAPRGRQDPSQGSVDFGERQVGNVAFSQPSAFLLSTLPFILLFLDLALVFRFFFFSSLPALAGSSSSPITLNLREWRVDGVKTLRDAGCTCL